MNFHYLWVVEMWNAEKEQWESTTDTTISRSEGREELAEWKQNNPDDKFRLVKYVREKP